MGPQAEGRVGSSRATAWVTLRWYPGRHSAKPLFGEPSDQFLQSYGAPPVVIGPTFAPKTIDLCAPGDTICDGTAGGGPTVAHALYGVNGMVGQAATFVAGRF
jgi:cutinase